MCVREDKGLGGWVGEQGMGLPDDCSAELGARANSDGYHYNQRSLHVTSQGPTLLLQLSSLISDHVAA